MPLHDWSKCRGWEGVHHSWLTELLRGIKPSLPAGYRAFIGTTPRVSIETPASKPDIGVRSWPAVEVEPFASVTPRSHADGLEPDIEVAVAAIETEPVLLVERGGWMVAAIEVVSPRNKDRRDSKTQYLSRYLGYLLDGVHLLLIDILPRPHGFSFADRIAEEFGLEQPETPTPFAVSYRVGEEAATGGRLLAVWRRPMTVGRPLPTIALPLTVHEAIPVDLERTYAAAAADAYLD
jgi:hypothetical protein